MAIIRPINSKLDLRDTSGEVTQPLTSNSLSGGSSVESPIIFGKVENNPKSSFENTSIYTDRGYIHLAIPVLNFFLAGDKAELLSRILEKDIAAIAGGELMYDTVNDVELSIKSISSNAMYNDKILIGGEYIKKLIDDFDVEAALTCMIKNVVFSGLKEQFDAKDCQNVDEYGVITKSKGEIPIVDGFYFSPLKPEVDSEMLKESIRETVVSIFSNYNNRLLLLLCLRESKDAIRNQVMEDMIVLPIGYRPPFQHKKDSITHAYNNVVKINNELSNSLLRYNTTLQTVRTCYFDLITAVKHVMTKNTNRYNKQHKPLVELLKGKEGHIRDRMQGSRIDYSGRGVIIVDPEMSLDTIGIPESMAVKLAELDIVKDYKTALSNKADVFHTNNTYLRRAAAKRLMEGKHITTGRQPTLYQLGLRGPKATIVNGNAIVLNPLITPAFNADFDGDQMHAEKPISPEAQREVQTLMSVTSNLFLPRSGECHVAPRQEIIYGLWKAHTIGTDHPNSNSLSIDGSSASYNDLLDKVCEQKINIYDKVTVKGVTESAGIVAIKACLGPVYSEYRLGVIPVTKNKRVEEVPIKESFFKELAKVIILDDKNKFVEITNKLVKLGFAIANIFPPSIPVLNFPDVSEYVREFDEKVMQREEFYNMGFETDAAFTLFYDTEYANLESKIKKALKGGLGKNNGYVDMIESGARGSMSNVMQLFGMKGRVMKNENEAFNAILKHPLATQLTGLEHYVTAYGARQGLVDKSIATFEPGYLSRQMSHSASGIHITNLDCGTDEGVLIDFDFVKQFLPQHTLTGEDIGDNKYVQEFIIKILEGRYVVGYENEINTKHEAINIYKKYVAEVGEDGKLIKKSGLKMRSPITCKNPCCAKCYGRDLGTNTPSVVGLPVGFIASQSIGEPGTQLIMKNFQSGGVAGVTNLTSSFDVMDQYMHIYDLKKAGDVPITYDYISPVEGYVETISRGDGTKTLKIKNMNKDGKMINKLIQKVVLYDDVKLKEYVEVGDSIQQIQGNLNVREIIKYRSAEYAQKYLSVMLYNIFQNDCYVNSKHFEVLVASMSFMLCVMGNKYFKSGKYYTLQEYYSHDRTGCDFNLTLKGVKEVPLYRNDLFSTIFMENMGHGIAHSIITSGRDEMKLPITRYSFGLRIGVGSDYPGYLESRGRI